MAFDVSAVSQWNDEHADRAEIIMTPLLAAKSMDYVEKVMGITGQNVKLPTFETTTPWQAGTGCGFNTSGTTTLNQFTITANPVTIQESICLNDLESKFATQWLPKGDKHESFQLVDLWINRKLAQIAKQIESAIWQAKTTYTNATWLKQFNGFLSTIDTAATAIAATQQASITTSTVRGIVEEIIFQKLLTIPDTLQMSPVVFMSMEDYMILIQKLLTDNAYNYFIKADATDINKMSFIYPGTNVEVVALPGLNSTNPVDTGALPTAVKHRIIATYKENLVVGMNAENDSKDAKVWWSDDNDQLRMKLRFHLGVAVKYVNHVVQYTNQ